MAQSVEQLTLNQRVPGSSPGAPTNHFNNLLDIGADGKNVVSALCPYSRCRECPEFYP
jgi:hypothetical protein